jgi:hypothetical protein
MQALPVHWLFTALSELESTKHVSPAWQSAALLQ